MTIQITALYAAILTLLVLALATLVTVKRAQTGIAILDGGNQDLGLAMRRHGNLVENLPLALLLMAFCEIAGMPALWLHAMGILLVVARLTHAVGLSATNPSTIGRIAGGAGTHNSQCSAPSAS